MFRRKLLLLSSGNEIPNYIRIWDDVPQAPVNTQSREKVKLRGSYISFKLDANVCTFSRSDCAMI